MNIPLDQAIIALDDLRRNDVTIQRGRNGELTAAFKAFWDSGPDEATFSKHTAGLLITPTVLYYMVTHTTNVSIGSAGRTPPAEFIPDPALKDGSPAPVPVVPAQKTPDTKKGGKHANR